MSFYLFFYSSVFRGGISSRRLNPDSESDEVNPESSLSPLIMPARWDSRRQTWTQRGIIRLCWEREAFNLSFFPPGVILSALLIPKSCRISQWSLFPPVAVGDPHVMWPAGRQASAFACSWIDPSFPPTVFFFFINIKWGNITHGLQVYPVELLKRQASCKGKRFKLSSSGWSETAHLVKCETLRFNWH